MNCFEGESVYKHMFTITKDIYNTLLLLKHWFAAHQAKAAVDTVVLMWLLLTYFPMTLKQQLLIMLSQMMS